MNAPRISIVTPSFNQAQFLDETICSVLSQNYPNLEYIIIDGGSTDNSVEIIRRYEKRLAYWTSETDRGQADAINKGWQRATGDILAYINSDDTYCPNALRLAAETFARHPDVGQVYGRCHVINERSVVLRERPVREASFAEVLRWSPSIPQPSMFVRRSAVETVGFLRTDLHYTMDYELSLRIGLKYKMQYIPHLLANMRDHPAAKTALDPLKHVEEGLTVADDFFQKTLPADIAELKNKTLASLYLRKARVLCRLNRTSEARTVIAQAFKLRVDPTLCRNAAIAWVMSLFGSKAIAILRRFKHVWLRSWTGRSP